MDLLTRFETGIAQARPVIAGADVRSGANPTPCPDWDVRTLINHMLGALTMFRDVATDGSADPALFTRDLVGDDALVSFDKVAGEVVAAWRARGLEGTATLPFGELPASVALELATMEMVVHAWDLAAATTQSVDWDQELLTENLSFVRATFASSEARGANFGPPVPVADDAPTIDRLVGFLGRK